MPRLARKYLESPYCHIIVQGINKEYIFKENNLKDAYRNILKKILISPESIKLVFGNKSNYISTFKKFTITLLI